MSLVELDVALESRPLEELAGLVVVEVAGVRESAALAVQHGIRCGEILTAARGKIVHGEWTSWLEGVGLTVSQASCYMRLSVYQHHLPDEASSMWVDEAGRNTSPGLTRALGYLTGLPAVRSAELKVRRDEACAMVASGMSIRETAELFGVSKRAVQMWTHPEQEAKGRKRTAAAATRRRRAARALRREEDQRERDALVKGASPDLSKAYGDLRKILASVGRLAGSENVDKIVKYGHLMEGAIVSAMQDERTDA